LEGEVILIGDLLKMATPLDYFSDGNFVQNSNEATEECCPLYTSFSYRVD
jgi:hypothetical protein